VISKIPIIQPFSWAAAREPTKILVDVPIIVQVPPRIAENEMGIRIFERLIFTFFANDMAIGSWTATAGVLLISMDTPPVAIIMFTIMRVGLCFENLKIFFATTCNAPVFSMAALIIRRQAITTVAWLENPFRASSGSRSPVTRRLSNTRIAVISTSSNSVKKSTIAPKIIRKRTAISTFSPLVSQPF